MLTKKITLLFLCSLTVSMIVISNCKAQESGYRIEADPFQYENDSFKQWTNDMIRIEITTEERGIIFRITITNKQTNALEIENLNIDVHIRNIDDDYNAFHKQISINYIYLPQNEEYSLYVPVTFTRYDVIGSYKAELSYTEDSSVSQNIEPYPFQFRILSEDQFQKELEQKKTALFNIGPIEVTIEIFGGMTFVIIGSLAFTIIILRRRRRSGLY